MAANFWPGDFARLFRLDGRVGGRRYDRHLVAGCRRRHVHLRIDVAWRTYDAIRPVQPLAQGLIALLGDWESNWLGAFWSGASLGFGDVDWAHALQAAARPSATSTGLQMRSAHRDLLACGHRSKTPTTLAGFRPASSLRSPFSR